VRLQGIFPACAWRTAAFQFIVCATKYRRPKIIFKDQDMPHVTKIAILAAFVAALAGISNTAAARGGLYPVTRCGPDLAYLCPIHGYFDQPPFHYNLAIYPGCIKVVPVQTPNGIKRRRAIVCGAPERTMIWW
jgi:hypothetical protein